MRREVLQRAQARGQLVDEAGVSIVEMAGGSLLGYTGEVALLDSTETFTTLGGQTVAEAIETRTVSLEQPETGGGLGFDTLIVRSGILQTTTPANNKILNGYTKTLSSDADPNKDYWGYYRSMTAYPDGSSNAGRYFVDHAYLESGEVSGPTGQSMVRGPEVKPAPGTEISSGCSTVSLGISLPGGLSASGDMNMCDLTGSVDFSDWWAYTRYAMVYDFDSKTLDRGKVHSLAFNMQANVTAGVKPYWWDYTQACFSDNFNSYGCTTANEPT
jgi:hypothetical protein